MNIDLPALLSFALITTFTPGPNNISSAAMGVNYGYKNTSRYLVGISSGFFILMCICGLLSGGLSELIPGFERILAIIGSLYIAWLAWHTFRSSYSFNGEDNEEKTSKPLGYINGLLLQLVNPKAIIYGITIYSAFLREMPVNAFSLLLTALIFALLAYAATSTWALFGTLIRRFMSNKIARLAINIVLALLLLWTAVKISGIMELVF